MSCETNSLKAGVAAAGAGINRLGSKTGAVVGRMSAGLSGAAGRTAAGTVSMMESFEGPESLDALGAITLTAEAAALIAPRRKKASSVETGDAGEVPGWAKRWMEEKNAGNARQQGRRFITGTQRRGESARLFGKRTAMALGLLKLGRAGAGMVGGGIGRLSRTGQAEQRFFFANTTRLPVGVWQSRLTPALNAIDSAGRPVLKSEGKMFEIKGQVWHRGTVTVKTAQGERTFTHLQSMGMPAAHYYFNRRLKDNEAVGAISGQKGFEPKYMEGYVGQITEIESLTPALAYAKRSLIQAAVFWGPESGDGDTSGNRNKARKNERNIQDDRHPPEQTGHRVNIGGQEYPVMVTKVIPTSGGPGLAQAAYYDGKVWREVRDSNLKQKLAQDVASGHIDVVKG